MKKNLLKLICAFLAIGLLIESCQKSINEPKEEIGSVNVSTTIPKNQCQLTYAVDWNSSPNWFHYNSKGLCDEWKIDFGSGIPDIFTMVYDNSNRLSSAEWHFDGALVGTIQFIWTGKNITTEHWDLDGFLFDVVNTWNSKGELIKREASYGIWATMEYSPVGNPVEVLLYLDGELIGSDVLTYNIPNRNPMSAIRGIPYAFPYANYVFGKFHETSDIYSIYDNGVPFVVLDTDPKQTKIQFGFQDYPSSITFFDRVSNSFMTRDFEYQNCGPENSAPANSSNPVLYKTAKKIIPHSLLMPRSKDELFKQIEERRKKH